ncbi:hypothetical protein CA951_06665 [Rhodococcus sp. NCIMB 12038]|nr:hypothetical protein CA951_06665 [Rhodococcus sp. NCIMB 12038]
MKGLRACPKVGSNGTGGVDGEQQIPSGARGYDGFGGHIGRTSAESTPWWKPEAKAPARAALLPA